MKRLFALLVIMLIGSPLMAQNSVLQVGSSAPEVSLSQPDGKLLSLSSLKGRLVLVDFWASWCLPCVQEQLYLKKIYEKNQQFVKEGKFQIFGVSLDRRKENWEKAIARSKITWPQVSDLKFWNSPIAKAYGIEALPFNVIVDENRKIIAINLHGKALGNFISDHLRSGK